jgi:hypothetical protein
MKLRNGLTMSATAIAEHRTDVYGAYRSDRFDTTIVDGCMGGIAAASADAYGTKIRSLSTFESVVR